MDKRKFYVDIRKRTHGKYRKTFRLSSDQMDDPHNRMEYRQPMSQLWSRPCLLSLVVEWEIQRVHQLLVMATGEVMDLEVARVEEQVTVLVAVEHRYLAMVEVDLH
jgi:hypothetical protein